MQFWKNLWHCRILVQGFWVSLFLQAGPSPNLEGELESRWHGRGFQVIFLTMGSTSGPLCPKKTSCKEKRQPPAPGRNSNALEDYGYLFGCQQIWQLFNITWLLIFKSWITLLFFKVNLELFILDPLIPRWVASMNATLPLLPLILSVKGMALWFSLFWNLNLYLVTGHKIPCKTCSWAIVLTRDMDPYHPVWDLSQKSEFQFPWQLCQRVRTSCNIWVEREWKSVLLIFP